MSQAGVNQYDLAIVGGGLVGASLACALAPLGVSIVLLEAVPPRVTAKPGYDDRTLALSASSCRILQGIGVWPLIEHDVTAIRKIYVTEVNRPGRVELDARELGLSCFGHVAEARVLGAAMMRLLPQLPGVNFVYPARLKSLEHSASGVRLSVQGADGDAVFSAGLVVGADGADSLVREALGIAVDRHDYGQTAVICNITPRQAHAGRAFEMFSPTGPFALLPHVGDRCGLVWCVASEAAEALMQLPDEAFLQQAQARFGDTLGPWQRVGRRTAYPLRLVRARSDTGPRALILGNAAHAIHPVGAQGFNLGLRDVAVVAELVAAQREQVAHADLGSPALLTAYSHWRAPDQSATIAYSDGLARLYANPTALAGLVRHAGLLAHALIAPLRRQLAVRAMGYRGRIPRLALGEGLGVRRDG